VIKGPERFVRRPQQAAARPATLRTQRHRRRHDRAGGEASQRARGSSAASRPTAVASSWRVSRADQDESRLLWMRGWETANMHQGSPHQRHSILADLGRRKRTWLAKAAERMSDAVSSDWREWRTAMRS